MIRTKRPRPAWVQARAGHTENHKNWRAIRLPGISGESILKTGRVSGLRSTRESMRAKGQGISNDQIRTATEHSMARIEQEGKLRGICNHVGRQKGKMCTHAAWYMVGRKSSQRHASSTRNERTW